MVSFLSIARAIVPICFSQIIRRSFQFCLSPVITCVEVQFYDAMIIVDLIQHYLSFFPEQFLLALWYVCWSYCLCMADMLIVVGAWNPRFHNVSSTISPFWSVSEKNIGSISRLYLHSILYCILRYETHIILLGHIILYRISIGSTDLETFSV